MSEPILIHEPAGAAQRLMLLFHGVGSSPQSLVPLGQRLASSCPQAAVLSVPSPDASDLGSGLQWFSVRGITEANRAARIAVAIPRFAATVRGLQRATGTTAEQTVLIGFSQGAIMALESSLLDGTLAGRVIAIAGRFAQLPQHLPAATSLHFIHGDRDPVVDHRHAVDAAERLVRLGGEVTVDLMPGLAHGISAEAVAVLLKRLKS